METNIHSRLNLLKDLKWLLQQSNIQEKMTQSFVLTQFVLAQISKLEVEVSCRGISIDDKKNYNHSITMFRKK
jgi:hypothetical protein